MHEQSLLIVFTASLNNWFINTNPDEISRKVNQRLRNSGIWHNNDFLYRAYSIIWTHKLDRSPHCRPIDFSASFINLTSPVFTSHEAFTHLWLMLICILKFFNCLEICHPSSPTKREKWLPSTSTCISLCGIYNKMIIQTKQSL